MKLIVMCLALWFAVGSIESIMADENKSGDSIDRSNLYHLTLPDGSVIAIYADLHTEEKAQQLEVDASLYPKGSAGYYKQYAIWKTKSIASVNYAANNESYYALVKATADRVIIFCTWNAQHCTLDKRTGQILKRGQGDNVLLGYDCLVPLKLSIVDRSSPSIKAPLITPEEVRELEKLNEEEEGAE